MPFALLLNIQQQKSWLNFLDKIDQLPSLSRKERNDRREWETAPGENKRKRGKKRTGGERYREKALRPRDGRETKLQI